MQVLLQNMGRVSGRPMPVLIADIISLHLAKAYTCAPNPAEEQHMCVPVVRSIAASVVCPVTVSRCDDVITAITAAEQLRRRGVSTPAARTGLTAICGGIKTGKGWVYITHDGKFYTSPRSLLTRESGGWIAALTTAMPEQMVMRAAKRLLRRTNASPIDKSYVHILPEDYPFSAGMLVRAADYFRCCRRLPGVKVDGNVYRVTISARGVTTRIAEYVEVLIRDGTDVDIHKFSPDEFAALYAVLGELGISVR